MQAFLSCRLVTCLLLCAFLLSACGGGSGGTSTAVAPSTTTVEITQAQFAQTHILPDGMLSWSIPNPILGGVPTSASLTLVGKRDTLALLNIPQPTLTNPMLEVWLGASKIGGIALNPSNTLPPTEDQGPAYSSTTWNAVLPAAWIQPGISIKVSSSNLLSSSARAVTVGADSDMTLKVLPFYLFGANDANTGTSSAVIATPDLATQQETYAKWPVAKLTSVNHPLGRIDLANIVIAPSLSSATPPVGIVPLTPQPAYVITSMNQQRDGFDVMRSVLSLIGNLRAANGESSTNNQYYAPILGLNTTLTTANKLYFLGGGLGSVGGGTGVGDQSYGGVFIHEQGHAMGLGHAGTEFLSGTYPYAGGSLAGSAWGYDINHNSFLSPYVPKSASTFATCLTSTARQPAVNGRCVKQDPMQGGAGDQAVGYKYAMFSDYNTGRMQKWFEGTTTLNATTGAHNYSGGRIFEDANSATGYSRWDSINKARVPVTPTTQSNGIYGLHDGLPIIKNVPVYAIALTLSHAGVHANNVTNGISQIYPPMAYTGNLLQLIDPSNAANLASIIPNTSIYPWYCHNGGCDYSVRVTYSDGTILYRVLQSAFRPWNGPMTALSTVTTDPINDPLNGASFKSWVINVPATNAAGAAVTITKTELLDTPMAWTMTAATLAAAPVLLTR